MTTMEEALSREEIERRAAEALARVPEWIWDGESLPVPIEDIADTCCGLLIRELDDLSAAPGAPILPADQSLSGLLLPQRGEIWINSGEAAAWPPRRRFTIGHELGHWHMHRDVRDGVFCRDSSIAADGGAAEPGAPKADRPPRPPREEEANMFAAALLMPAHLMQRHYRETGGDFHRLCELFGASQAAMGRRLHAVIPRAG